MISNRFLKAAKNEDIQFLGEKMSENKWLGQLVVLAYSLLPLPTTPFFGRRNFQDKTHLHYSGISHR